MEAKAAPPDRLNLTDARNAVTALYEAQALGLIRLAVVMLSDRGAVVQRRGQRAIGAIPNSGHGRVGVISGNEFTPLAATFSAGAW